MTQTANALGAARVFEDTSALGARRSPGGFFTTLALLALACPALAAEEVRFTISNPARLPVATVARVSLPIPAGYLAGPPPGEAIFDGKTVPVQARPLTRHPDGSIRRVMLSVPVSLPPGGMIAGIYRAGAPARPTEESIPAAISTDRWKVVLSMDRIELRGDGGLLLASVERFGPEEDGGEPAVRVLDGGPEFVWLRYDRTGDPWGRQWMCRSSARESCALCIAFRRSAPATIGRPISAGG